MPGNPLAKPAVIPTPETAPFWHGAAAGKLLFQVCGACGHAQFPPRPVCLNCRGTALDWRESAGRGSVFSFTVVHRAPLDSFRVDVPYVVALIDLEEGPRMMMNIRRCAPEQVRIGAPVITFFESYAEGVALPQAMLEE
jgi:uncharacterized OB-fold protein